jgi:type IV secretory pathway VirB10-like protein
MRFATVLLAISLSLGLSGCWFGKKKTPVTPAPPQPPAPQQTTPATPEVKPQAQAPEQEQPPAPAPPPVKKNAPPEPAPQRTPQPAGQAPLQPAPQLGVILPANRRRQYEAEYAQSLSRARAALQQVSGKALSQTQRETVERIKTFIQQAEESKAKDLATAFELVRRADLLGQDLLKYFQ